MEVSTQPLPTGLAMNEEMNFIEMTTVQITVLSCAVEALIATHQRADEVRRVFDQLFGQVLAGCLATGTTPAGAAAMREYAQKVFLPPETLS